MLNRDVSQSPTSGLQPDRSRPLQRKIAQHRERDLGTRNQYSTYDKMNDEQSAYAWTDPGAGGGLFGYGGGWDYSWEYWAMRVGVGVIMSVIFLIARGCNGGGA